MKKKTVALLMACVMALGVAVGGTMAWLTDESGDVVNTFTVGDINIELTETDKGVGIDTTEDDNANEYYFVPGDTLTKDPKVTVKAKSEDCYLFVKVDVENNSCTDDTLTPNVSANPIISWTIADGWTAYGDVKNAPKDGTYYYYRQVSKSDNDQSWEILTKNTVNISEAVTKGMVTKINNEQTKPTLTFTAAAVQIKNLADDASKTEAENLAAAWAELPEGFTPAP